MNTIEEKRELALRYAWTFLGRPYSWGGNDPMKGFDCCLPADTPILTSAGFKPIQDMRQGDKIFTYQDGKLIEGEVVNLFENSTQDIYILKTRNSRLKASGNHPFLKIVHKIGIPGWDARKKIHLIWEQCKNLEKGNCLITLNQFPFKNTLDFSNEFIWFLGAFLGDGHIADRHMFLAFYDKELRDKAISKMSKFIHNKITPHPAHGLYFSDYKLAGKLKELGLNKKSYEKQLPPCIWEMSKSQIKQFLEGYTDADGYRFYRANRNYGGIHFAASSFKLINELQLLLRFFEGRVENINTQERLKPIYIKGKKIKNPHPMYRFSWYPQSKRNGERTLQIKDFRQLLGLSKEFGIEIVGGVEKIGKSPTYNLETTTGTFIAENFVVHNSGLCCEILQGVGLINRKSDYTARGLFDIFCSLKVRNPYKGCLVFFGDKNKEINHVEFCINDKFAIGASGGGRCVRTIEDAIKYNAFIKIRPIYSRKGIIGFVDPFI